jgi:nucleotide-binding universal stress UspA family protein
MFHKIMVAYDESPEAERALQVAIDLARAVGAELAVVTVLEPPPFYYSFAMVGGLPAVRWTEEQSAKFTALQAKARRQAKAAGLMLDAELISGDEVGTIIDCTIKHHSDLLVLGLRKHTWLMGSTTRDLSERAPCALLGIR